MSGPPFAVSRDEIQELYEEQFNIIKLHREARFDVLSKFKLRGLESYFDEVLYHLKPVNEE